MHLYGMERDGDPIPEPSSIKDIKPEENGVIILVEAFMPPVRERINNRYVKKTLSIPYWLMLKPKMRE